MKAIKFLAGLMIGVHCTAPAQHGVGTNWGPEVLLPRFNESLNAKQRGVLYNNMVATKGGRIIISTSEMNPSNMNQIYGHYLTYSDDGGQSWVTPVRFTPTDLVIGGSSVKLAMDNNDTLYVLWTSVNPNAIYISKLDSNLNVIKDSIRVSNPQLYNNFATHFTIDRYNRIHVMWHEGNTNSSSAAEAFYTRSTNRGLTWSSTVPISTQDGHHSAFPHAQFDFAGDTLAIAWRDSVGGTSKWDVYMVYSTNGGQNWSPATPVISGVDADWDPDVFIDPMNRIHLFYTKYPAGDPFNGARNYYQYSDDVGATWNLPNSPSNGMFSDNFRSQLIEGIRYDAVNNVLYVTWKDERDFDFTTGAVKGDVMLAYTTDRGLTWSSPEFITDRHDSTAGFKAGLMLPTGEFCTNYEVLSQDDINDPSTSVRVYFRKRAAVVTGINDNTPLSNDFHVYQNYPNPFNSTTKITWQSPIAGHQTLKIYDIFGNELATLVDEERPVGKYEVEFDADKLSSGVYFYKITAGTFSKVKPMLLLK